jgi:hypothetical protein
VASVPDDCHASPLSAYDPARSRDGALPVADHRSPGVHELHENILAVQGGPNTIDVLIDLLIDGERGVWTATQEGVHPVGKDISSRRPMAL